MFRNRTVSLALVGLFLWVTACTSYRQIELAEVADHGKVRVTLTDGEHETLRDPWVEADSIRAHENRESERDYYDPIVVIPLDEVVTLEAVGTDAAKTTGTVALVLVGIAAVAFGILAIGYAMDQ